LGTTAPGEQCASDNRQVHRHRFFHGVRRPLLQAAAQQHIGARHAQADVVLVPAEHLHQTHWPTLCAKPGTHCFGQREVLSSLAGVGGKEQDLRVQGPTECGARLIPWHRLEERQVESIGNHLDPAVHGAQHLRHLAALDDDGVGAARGALAQRGQQAALGRRASVHVGLPQQIVATK
jgi:hypothetical protein